MKLRSDPWRKKIYKSASNRVGKSMGQNDRAIMSPDQ